MSNGTPKLVAPTIDAQMGRTLQTTSARCEQIQGMQNNGVEPITFPEMERKPDGGTSSPRLRFGFDDRRYCNYQILNDG